MTSSHCASIKSRGPFILLIFWPVAVGGVAKMTLWHFSLWFVIFMTMGIILFLVDTSASMNQKTFLGTSYLDVAKGAIDTFMKVGCDYSVWSSQSLMFLAWALKRWELYVLQVLSVLHFLSLQYRSRDPASNGDHYMLVSFDDPPTAIKVGGRRYPVLYYASWLISITHNTQQNIIISLHTLNINLIINNRLDGKIMALLLQN